MVDLAHSELKTPLFASHVSLGAKMVPFAGWVMPIQYEGVIQEHRDVLEGVGLFDVSHMGKIDVQGEDAERFLDYLSTNRISGKKPGACVYTVWARENGTCVDDVIVFRHTDTDFFVIVNASNREKDLSHMQLHAAGFDVQIIPRFTEVGIIAVQGPKSKEFLARYSPEMADLKPMTCVKIDDCIVARTGYTGCLGYECIVPVAKLEEYWSEMLRDGAKPIGLAARDTLRLEAGFALYGHELSDTILAHESISAWTVRMEKDNFVGKKALQSPARRFACGIQLLEAGVAREGTPVYQNDRLLGELTSGTHSPVLKTGIGLAILNKKLEPGSMVEVEVRKRRFQAKVITLPFCKH